MPDVVPSLRLDLNVTTAWSLPEWSIGPHGDEQTMLEAAKAAGYQGIQGANPRRCRELGLVPTTFELQPTLGGLRERVQKMVDRGFACCTILLGTGMEDDDAAAALVEEVLNASAATQLPLYVETHRATVTQDIWRTVQLVKRFPELRFNGDFSHWYTGAEMSFGDFDAKLEFIAPVLERVRYMHGRIGAPGCMQVDVGDGSVAQQPSTADFRELWTRSFAGFIGGVRGDSIAPLDLAIGFAPELLPAEAGYARTWPDAHGAPREESDRWEQALVLCRIASECFSAAGMRRAAEKE